MMSQNEMTKCYHIKDGAALIYHCRVVHRFYCFFCFFHSKFLSFDFLSLRFFIFPIKFFFGLFFCVFFFAQFWFCLLISLSFPRPPHFHPFLRSLISFIPKFHMIVARNKTTMTRRAQNIRRNITPLT